MLTIQAELLAEALQKVLPGMERQSALVRAKELVTSTDARLEQNVLEWARNQTITDVWIGKYCINAIMAIQKDGDFLRALDAMNLYLKDPRLGEMRIWQARR